MNFSSSPSTWSRCFLEDRVSSPAYDQETQSCPATTSHLVNGEAGPKLLIDFPCTTKTVIQVGINTRVSVRCWVSISWVSKSNVMSQVGGAHSLAVSHVFVEMHVQIAVKFRICFHTNHCTSWRTDECNTRRLFSLVTVMEKVRRHDHGKHRHMRCKHHHHGGAGPCSGRVVALPRNAEMAEVYN